MYLYKNSAFWLSAMSGLFLLAASIVSVFASTQYLLKRESAAIAPDIFLSNIPPYNVDGIFVYGALLLVAFITILVIIWPRYLPFTLKAIASLYFIRSVFVSLTPLSPFPDRIIIDVGDYFINSRFFQVFFTGNDLFFSGHTALPFLMTLIFWDNKPLRYIFLLSSGLFAAVVLLGHFHYSIDVLAAYFITYSIYVIARRLFHSDFTLIERHAAPIV